MRSEKGREWEREQMGLPPRGTVSPKLAFFTRIWSIVYTVLLVLFIFMVFKADILPVLFVILLVLVLGAISFFLIPMLFFKNVKKNRKIPAIAVSTVLILVFLYGIIGLGSVAGFFSTITENNDKYAKPVNVTKDSYNIYISGLDVSGKINVKSRSDVNMIMTVNPKTQKILLTSIPRDTLVKLKTKGDALDKLTHTGIYGIGTTLSSVEDLTGLDMNYYVKVNYSTVREFVDAIGGVDVKSDYEFDTHGMKDKFHFNKGINHLDGAHALAFARERKSFPDGDIQRNKNQAKVMQAMIKKASSSTTIMMRFTGILNSCKDYMRINLTNDDIKRVVKMQIGKGYKWKTKKQSIEGTPGFSQCYSTGAYNVSVINVDPESLSKCVARINKVMEKEE